MTDRETFLTRAAAARADAAKATLDNVRERCLRSEAAWSEMAERAERTERMRESQLADKAAAARAEDKKSKTKNDFEQDQLLAPAASRAVSY